MNNKYLETAIMFSRMYGVAETLHEWEYLGSEEFIIKMKNWTEEFLSMENGDILKFFEAQLSE